MHSKSTSVQLALSFDESVLEGLCQCGCGAATEIATLNRTDRGWVKGKPKRFIVGHGTRKSGVEYIVKDCGYKTPCWVWQLTLSTAGYGMATNPTKDGRKRIEAHRIVYEREQGPIPEGLDLDHLCRNRRCVRPDHLEPVTRSVNILRGTVHLRKLTEDDVRQIRRLAETTPHGMTVTDWQREIGHQFGVGQANVWHIVKRLTWKHVV